MRRLLVFALVVFAGWYGWNHYKGLRSQPASEVVIENQSGRALLRVRIEVGGRTEVRERIEDGASARIPFRIGRDSPLHLRWQFERTEVDKDWSGGLMTAGPVPTRHHLQVLREEGVAWSSERIEVPAGK